MRRSSRRKKRPVEIPCRDVERDCQSIVYQLLNSITKDVLLRTSCVEQQQLTSTKPTQGVSVEPKSNVARKAQFVDAKEEYESRSDCLSGDKTLYGGVASGK